jgi:hypothetical protein
MLDEHGVGALQPLVLRGTDAPEVQQARTQQRIREQPHAVQLDEHCRVADDDNARARLHPGVIVGAPSGAGR